MQFQMEEPAGASRHKRKCSAEAQQASMATKVVSLSAVIEILSVCVCRCGSATANAHSSRLRVSKMVYVWSSGTGAPSGHFPRAQAAVTAIVALVFWAVYLLSWEASESMDRRAIQAKTIAHNQVLRTKQLHNCSMSQSSCWSLSSHNINSEKQYCVLLARQVELRSENICLRRVYCTKCPTSCPSYEELCAERTCFASPAVPVPRNTQPWPASCVRVATGTPCTTACKSGYKPATEGSPPSTTCMTGDVAGESPFQDAWSPALGSCVPDKLELQQILKVTKMYHINEGLSCLLWRYCAWYLRVFGLSAVTNFVVIWKSILHTTQIDHNTGALQRLLEMSTVVMGVVIVANSVEAVTSVVLAAVAYGLVTAKWFALPCSMACEIAYARHSYLAYYLNVCLVEPSVAFVTWTLALACFAMKALWHTVQPGLAHGMRMCLQLSGQVFMHCLPYIEMHLNLQLDSVDGEPIILFEDPAENCQTCVTHRGAERGSSEHCDDRVTLPLPCSSISSWLYSFVDGVDFILLRIQVLVTAVLAALGLVSNDATHITEMTLRCSELSKPLDTISEGEETAGTDGHSASSSNRESDASDSKIKPAAIAEVGHSSVAAAHAKAGVISCGPLLSFGSDVNGVVQIALSPQSAGKKDL